MPQLNPIQSPAQLPAPTDMGAVTLAKAIRTVESNGNFNATGKSGEQGAYQFMPSTWKSWAGQYLGDPNAPLTPENQNKVAYSKIVDLKNQGFTPEQVASIWNSGKPDYQGNVGINSKGVAFNTPKYVSSVIDKFQQLKQGVQNGPTIPNPSMATGIQADQPKSVGGFIGNIFGSAGNLIGGLADTIFHPIQTVQGIGNAITHPGQIVDALKQRYGSLQNIGNTLYSDPVGVALDVSTLLGGVGLAGKLGAEGSDLAKIGQIATKASDVTNPLTLAGKAASKMGDVAGGVFKKGASLSTGSPVNAFQIAQDVGQQGGEAQKAFNLAMAGKDNLEAILQDAKNAYQGMATQRANDYRASLANIKSAQHTLTPETLLPIQKTFDSALENMQIVKNADGTLDFSGSVLDGNAGDMRRVQQLQDKITFAMNNPEPVAVDNLKRFASDTYKPGEPLNAITQPIKHVTADVLNNNVPTYENMTSQYHQASNTLDEIKGALGVGGKAQQEAVLNKLMASLNENKGNRLNALGKLGSDKFLAQRIAGLKLSNMFPGGLQKYAAELGFGGALAMGQNPAILLSAIGTSPKVMGKIAENFGTTTRKATQLTQAVSKLTGLQPSQVALILSQVNRASQTGQ